jgi:hypothetical protein
MLKTRTYIGLLLSVLLVTSSVSRAQDVLPWEYKPYKINCWLTIDPALGWSEPLRGMNASRIASAISARFGAAAEIYIQPSPKQLEGDFFYSSSNVTIDQLLGRELVVATSKLNADAKDARTFERATEKFKSIQINPVYFGQYKEQLARFADFKWSKAIDERLEARTGPTSDVDGADPVAMALLKGEIPMAIVPRSFANDHSKELRILPAVYPWHLQSELSRFDKIHAINLRRADYGIDIEVCELDCLFRTVSRWKTQRVVAEAEISTSTAYLCAEVFVPMVRLESAEASICRTRVRARELIAENDAQEAHPCFVGVGDVLRPIMRRDNRDGEPTLIQTIPWTYIVAYGAERSILDCAVYSGRQGALLGRPNRRLHRMALLVKPQHDSTDVQLRVARDMTRVVSGSSIFQRIPGGDGLELVGRSDWRGVFTITETENPLCTYELPIPKDSQPAEAATAKPAEATSEKPAEATAATAEKSEAKTDDAAAKTEQEVARVEPPKGTVQANAPLYFYFVKSGNSLLAKLPIVTGDEQLFEAPLGDDAKRLEAEALIRGLEGRIFDTVALRALLQQKAENSLASNKLKEARKELDQLKLTKNYESFREDLTAIQTKVLTTSDPIPQGALKRIQKLFNDTGTSLQKFVQSREGEARVLEGQLLDAERRAPPEEPAAEAGPAESDHNEDL